MSEEPNFPGLRKVIFFVANIISIYNEHQKKNIRIKRNKRNKLYKMVVKIWWDHFTQFELFF